MQKYSFAIPQIAKQFLVRDNYLYVLTSSCSVSVYDLATKLLVADKSFPYRQGLMAANMFLGDGTQMYVKYVNQAYDGQSGRYYYVNYFFEVDLSHGIPQGSRLLDIAAMNPDSNDSENYWAINMSPDAKYVTCNRYGDVYDLQSRAINRVGSSGSPSNVQYSCAEKYLMGFQLTGSSPMPGDLRVFALPSFKYVGTYNNHNLMGLANVYNWGDFIDGDSLVSYQWSATLKFCVAFKRIGT